MCKKVKKIAFGILKLEMADLERFWRKTPLGPLGVNELQFLFFVGVVSASIVSASINNNFIFMWVGMRRGDTQVMALRP
jgi:hypothetical protein